MAVRTASRPDITLRNVDKVRIEEVFRLGALRDGLRLLTSEIRLPIFGQVIPRIEIEITGPGFAKKVTVRVNQDSPFMFDGKTLKATINGEDREVVAVQFIDEDRAPTGMYDFGMLRENGLRSFVFDYHTYCSYSCEFCFKESEWEVLSLQEGPRADYKANFQECLEYVKSHAEDFQTKYDVVWLVTGSITNEKLELERHCTLARALREVGYQEDIFVSQVVPAGILRDRARRMDYLQALKDAGITRFNSGVEIVNTEYRKRYVHGYKGTITFDDFVAVFTDAIEVFGKHGAGSCLLAGIESPEETLRGLDIISEIGVVPAPTVFTPFVVKQYDIEFMYDLDTLIDVHVGFNEIVEKYQLPVFSGVFSLA